MSSVQNQTIMGSEESKSSTLPIQTSSIACGSTDTLRAVATDKLAEASAGDRDGCASNSKATISSIASTVVREDFTEKIIVLREVSDEAEKIYETRYKKSAFIESNYTSKYGSNKILTINGKQVDGEISEYLNKYSSSHMITSHKETSVAYTLISTFILVPLVKNK